MPSDPSASIEQRALALVGNVAGLLELEDYHRGLLVALQEIVPSDWVSFNEVGPTPESTFAIVEPSLPESSLEVFKQLAPQNPLVVHYQQTWDGQAIRFSDVATPAELHATDIYRELYGPLRIEYQIAFTLPSSADRLLAIALCRTERDFTDSERDLLNLSRPHLIQGYRNAVIHTDLLSRATDHAAVSALLPLRELRRLGLTEREAEVLRLVAMGRSDGDAAVELGISRRTAQKHLEHCYRVLGVNGRSQAAKIVWDAVKPT